MKNVIIGLFLMIFSFGASAQLKDMEIIWGQPFKSKKTVVTDIISVEDGEIYAIKQKLGFFNQDVYLDKYKDLEPLQSSELKFDDDQETEVSKNIIELAGNLWMLDLRSSKNGASLQAQLIDKKTLKAMGESIDIFDIEIIRTLRYTYGGFNYAVSKDKQYIGFVTQYPGSRGDVANLGFQVFDKDFNVVFDEELELETQKEFVDLAGVDVDAEGRVSCLLQIFEPKRLNSSKRGNEFHYEYYSMDRAGQVNMQSLLLENTKKIQSIHFEMNEKGQSILAGFYGSNCCTIEGSFFMLLHNATNKTEKYSLKAFDFDFIAEGLSDKSLRKLQRQKDRGEDVGIDNVDFKDFILREDGSMVLVGELYNIDNGNYNSKVNQSGDNVHFNYKSILVVSIDQNGEINWTKKILKSQLTVDDGGFMSGFALAVNKNKLHFIFNDHKDNLNVTSEDELLVYQRKKRTSVVTLVTLDAEGTMTREPLISQRDMGLEIRPQSCTQISENEVILFGMSKKENQLGRLIF